MRRVSAAARCPDPERARAWPARLAGLVLGLALAGLVVSAAHVASARGRDLLWHVRGFRAYMDTAEADRQRFAEKEGIFAAYLPYAIVFGLVTKWARAFSGLDAQRAVQGWYIGPSVMSLGAFSTGLAGFSSTLSTTLASAPGPSGASGFGAGGFGGGGFEGGGGGGGGGGSW